MAAKSQIFFSTWPENLERYGLSGRSMSRNGDQIYFECVDFDTEDQRAYTYAFSYGLDVHHQMLDALRSKGRFQTDYEGRKGAVTMTLHGDEVTIQFEGCGGSTGGGALVHSTVTHVCKLNDLLLEVE